MIEKMKEMGGHLIAWIVAFIELGLIIPAIIQFIIGHIDIAFYILIACIIIITTCSLYAFSQRDVVKVAVGRRGGEGSLKLLEKEVYPRIFEHLEKDKTHTVNIYEANLETSVPTNILEKDKDLAKSKHTVHWRCVILENKGKKNWVTQWKKNIKDKNDLCKLKIIQKEIDWPMVNLYAVRELNLCFIGFGKYENLGVEGGILLRSKKATNETIELINGWYNWKTER